MAQVSAQISQLHMAYIIILLMIWLAKLRRQVSKFHKGVFDES
jgi:hypothetical protein